jgi:hypothetical protein
MSYLARGGACLLAAAFALLFTTGVRADDLTITITGSPVTSGAYAGESVSGSLDVAASPDSLGDGGLLVTSITGGSLTFTTGSTSTTDSESGLVPLTDGAVDPRYSGYVYDYFICDSPSCFHYWSYDNLLYPGTPDLSDGLLFTLTGVSEPVELFCSSSGTCDLGLFVGSGGNDPYDSGFEYFPVTVALTEPVLEPSSLLLLGMGLCLLIVASFSRRAWFERSGEVA